MTTFRFKLRFILFSILLMFFSCVSKKRYEEAKQNLKYCEMIGEEVYYEQAYTNNLEKYENEINELEEAFKVIELEMQSMESILQKNEETKLKLQNDYVISESTNEMLQEEIQDLNNSNLSLLKKMSEQNNNLDSIIPPREINYSLNEGRLAFYCPREMNYKEQYTVMGLIADVISNKEARSVLVDKLKSLDETIDVKTLNNDSILIREIKYHKLIELVLDKASNKSFEIKKIHFTDKQEVKPNMEGWHWQVTPLDPEPNQKLILKVLYYDENNLANLNLSKIYPISIKIKPNRFFTNLKTQFIENTEWAVGSIIIPFLTFLFGRYFNKKKEKTVV